MMSFLGLVNDLNDAHAQFVSRFEDEHESDPELNPISLHDRLRALQTKMAELKPRIEELQNAREEIIEALLSSRSLETIAQKLPEVTEQVQVAERSLDAARLAARGGSGFVNGGGRETARRATRVEREARLASAMDNSNPTPSRRTGLVTKEMHDALPMELRKLLSLPELQASCNLLLRCGGRLSRNSFSSESARVLSEMGVASVDESTNELCLSREYGVLLL